ncbi:hypothetical protein PAAG_11736 [Paracoccidioides lutzii Pb01]|uniref:Uncharacterized protein n=1 Tax=Paracoccidioides lutzii (strain ATCC MYA-826 / Pb01) TaxID=502779 RepID=A0A0A2V108_PARBA|nr:hypothetical protein PAAG_11736 [Paracoccidioides lutzii Pb01]KGQ01501.1 hypothetical protein PAAG_11736 [Paracoccidioides lutzii Pb01]
MEHLDVFVENRFGSALNRNLISDPPYSYARHEENPSRSNIARFVSEIPKSARRIPRKTILVAAASAPAGGHGTTFIQNQRVKAKNPRSGGARSKRTRELIATLFEL